MRKSKRPSTIADSLASKRAREGKETKEERKADSEEEEEKEEEGGPASATRSSTRNRKGTSSSSSLPLQEYREGDESSEEEEVEREPEDEEENKPVEVDWTSSIRWWVVLAWAFISVAIHNAYVIYSRLPGSKKLSIGSSDCS
jgi:hypothetical protein